MEGDVTFDWTLQNLRKTSIHKEKYSIYLKLHLLKSLMNAQ